MKAVPCRAVTCQLGAIIAWPLQAQRKATAALPCWVKKLTSLPGTAISEGEPTPPAAWAQPGLSAFG